MCLACLTTNIGYITQEMSSSNSAILSLVIYKEEHETFGFGLSNALSAEGCYICAVGRESPAERAGLRKYDRVIQVSQNAVKNTVSRLG